MKNMTKQQKRMLFGFDVVAIALGMYAFASDISYLPQMVRIVVTVVASLSIAYVWALHQGYIGMPFSGTSSVIPQPFLSLLFLGMAAIMATINLSLTPMA